MAAPSPRDRVEKALSSSEPFPALLFAAEQLRDEGMAQSELSALFDSFRARHAADTDETRLNAILDTLDFIVGWCSPSKSIYQ
jgi:hypothetical protein